MNDKKKTKEQLINELSEMRQRVAELEKSEAELKPSERALRESEEKFRILAEINTAAIVIFQGDKLRYVNPATETLTGYTKEELLKINFWGLVHPEFRELVKERWFARLRGEKVDQIVEFKITTKSGKMRWLSVSDGIIELEGKPVGIGTAFDVTERKKAEEALKESEEKYRNLADNALVGIYRTNLKGDILYVNEALLRMLEFDSREEMMSVSALRTYKNPNDREILIEALKKKGRISNFEIELLTKKGKSKAVILNATLEEDIISGMMMDITERKEIEDSLKESEQRFRSIFDNASDGIIIADVETKKFYLGNKMICQMLGYDQEKIKDLTVMDIHPEKDLPHVLNQFEKLAKGEIILTENISVKRKDGSVFYVDINTSWITLSGKSYIAGIFRDITERKRIAEALRESEERYRTIFEDSREAIYISSREGKFIDFNQSALDLFGFTREEMIGLDILQIYVNPADRYRFQQEIEQNGSVRNYEVKFRKKDGKEMDCLLTSTVRKDIDGTILGYQGIIRDITEIKKVENQLRHLSLHDPLTGLYNRAYFEEEMRRLESGRFDSVGIIMCDVDGLKLVNDALGHYNGDKLLMATANALRESFREGDVIARVGGDEFAVLLPASDSNTIEIASHRIQDAVARYNSSNLALPLSISVGSALSTETPIIMSNLFKEADNNMYREKLHHSLTARSTIVQTLMKALETRDFVTDGHVTRLQKLVDALSKAIGLSEHSTIDLRHLAEFHDIGKVGIPDHIIFKQGNLTPEEVIEMQRHCEIGHRIALCTPDLIPIADLILKHHEWWNGKGYPLGLKGEEIPLECRILAIAEAYEAMTSNRPYHKAISHNEAVAKLQKYAGTKFDPDILAKFIQVLESHKN
jgi:diguanylate cyclase (GGDEF)-like protein/PAS domain S-box-containing protein